MGRFSWSVLVVGFSFAVAALPMMGCSGTSESDGPPEGGTSGGGSGGGGGTVHLDGGWPDGGGGFPSGGTGATGGSPTGGGTGGTGGILSGGGTGGGTGGTGAVGGTGAAGGTGATGGTGGTGGCAAAETCNNKDDNCNGLVDDGLTQSCSSSCGSGTQTCSAGVWGACSALVPKTCKNWSTCQDGSQCVASCPTAPSETCNLKDDNCDNNCDDFANCRQGVHRSSKVAEHFYTTNLTEASCCGFTLEYQNFYYLYKAQTGSLLPFHRCLLSTGKHFYTTASNCEGAPGSTMESVMGYIAPAATCGAAALYRLSHPTNSHFYTTSLSEKNNAVASYGYIDEGVAGYVWAAP